MHFSGGGGDGIEGTIDRQEQVWWLATIFYRIFVLRLELNYNFERFPNIYQFPAHLFPYLK
jgi:hypothetical protein